MRYRTETIIHQYNELGLAKAVVGASLVAQLVKNLPAMQETWVQFLGWEDTLEKEMAAHSSIPAMDRGDWQATVHEVTRVNQHQSCCCLVTKSCLTICDLMDCTVPGFSVCGIPQARILEWVVIYFSRASSRHRDQIFISCIAGRFFLLLNH